jgi:hypothetical protein
MSDMKVVDPTLKWFTNKCRAKLAKPENQRKKHWRELSDKRLMALLRGEIRELRIVLRELHSYDRLSNADGYVGEIKKDVISECTDVANFSMMIADKMRQERAKR